MPFPGSTEEMNNAELPQNDGQPTTPRVNILVYRSQFQIKNVFEDLPQRPTSDEQFVPLLVRSGLTVERIVSTGQITPSGEWYDQPHGEWILLLRGAATLRFADEPDARDLRPGDHLDIAPHRRHRVEWTSLDEATIWLAVHYSTS